MHILIIGCGYVGERVAKHWTGQHTVSALTRSVDRAAQFETLSINRIVGDVLDASSLKQLPEADLCLYAVGYDRSVPADKRDVYVNGLKNVLTEIRTRIPRLIYVSSSSVYAQSHGESVNEESVCRPTAEGGKICLAAESVVRDFYDQSSATILRLAGIYGPDRLIGRRQQLLQQSPISGNPDAWLNLIHVADIVSTLDAIAVAPPPSDLYLLSDGNPLHRIEFYRELARQLELPEPNMPDAVDANLGKRCDPSRALSELNLNLQFPDVRAGLASSL